MQQTITMPALSDTMNAGRLIKWLKEPGDPIKTKEAIAEIETDKAVMEVEAFHDGYLAGPLAAVGEEIKVGATIGYITDSPAVAPTTVAAVAVAAHLPTSEPVAQPVAVAVTQPAHSVRASPYARVLARDLKIDLTQTTPGPAGAIDAVDILIAAHEQGQPDLDAGPPYRIERASSLREAVARGMIASSATPTFRVSARLPLAPLKQLAHEKHLSLVLLLARACALTVVEHPIFNAVHTPQGLAHRERVDVGIAVDDGEGLITPVMRDMAGRTLSELADEWRVLLGKVKSRRIFPKDYRGASFYISDLGVFPGVDSFDSIIPVGASAILSVAAERDGLACSTLSCDHRVVFGADAARFLQTLAGWLTAPATLAK